LQLGKPQIRAFDSASSR